MEYDIKNYIRLAGGSWGGSLICGHNGEYSSVSGDGVYTTGNMSARNYYVMEGDNTYQGQDTEVFSVKAYVNGEEKYVGLQFIDGILVGKSNV